MFLFQATDGQDKPDSDTGAGAGGGAREDGSPGGHVTPDQLDSAEADSPPSVVSRLPATCSS